MVIPEIASYHELGPWLSEESHTIYQRPLLGSDEDIPGCPANFSR